MMDADDHANGGAMSTWAKGLMRYQEKSESVLVLAIERHESNLEFERCVAVADEQRSAG